MKPANSLLNTDGLHKSELKLPSTVLAILQKLPVTSTWKNLFDARIAEDIACQLFYRACDIGVSPNNISNATCPHLKACKVGSKNRADGGCVVELDLDVLDSDSPSKKTRQKIPLGVAKGGLITAE